MSKEFSFKLERKLVAYGLILFSLFTLTSCDFILKDRKSSKDKGTIYTDGGKSIVGEEDEHGCTYSAGYRWSLLKQDCIRVFEEGFRLNPLTLEEGDDEENELEDNEVSCFVIFEKGEKKAEIFLPNNLKSIVLENKNIKGVYSNDGWELDTRSKFVLKRKGEIAFTAAKAVELKVINSDQMIEEETEQ
ncbi:MAG: hypothetical protein LBI72_09030 [Flavobacteriaceae bacterium]|jgi:hypothetical protein|nr:hypothetical protein [Flavobacteriaceae bacterium]